MLLSSRFRSPLPDSPGWDQGRPIPHPKCPILVCGQTSAGPGGAWLLVPDTSDRHQGHLVPPHGHPGSKEGEVPAALELCLLPAVHCCHALPNLSATSRFPDISELRSPQQQFGGGSSLSWLITVQTPPRPSPGVQPAQSAAFFTFSSPPSLCSRGRLPQRVTSSPAGGSAAPAAVPPPAPAASRRPRQRPWCQLGSARSRALTLCPPSGSRSRHAARLQPSLGWGAWSAPFFRAPRAQAGEVRGHLSVVELSWEWCWGRAREGDGRTTIRPARPPAPRTPHPGLRTAPCAPGPRLRA